MYRYPSINNSTWYVTSNIREIRIPYSKIESSLYSERVEKIDFMLSHPASKPCEGGATWQDLSMEVEVRIINILDIKSLRNVFCVDKHLRGLVSDFVRNLSLISLSDYRFASKLNSLRHVAVHALFLGDSEEISVLDVLLRKNTIKSIFFAAASLLNDVLLNALGESLSLKALKFGAVELKSEIIDVFSKSRSLTELSLHNPLPIKIDEMVRLATHPHINTLSMTESIKCFADFSDAEALVFANSETLTKLDLRGYEISELGIQALKANRYLKSLRYGPL